MITYRKGSLFDAPEEVYLAHACNAQGAWGSGIAKQFYDRFPEDYDEYHEWCQTFNRTGSTLITWNKIVCLVTSEYYGSRKDSEEEILFNTQAALIDMLEQLEDRQQYDAEIHMPKINAGLFGVPWEKTEEVIRRTISIFPNMKDLKVVVWELEPIKDLSNDIFIDDGMDG